MGDFTAITGGATVNNVSSVDNNFQVKETNKGLNQIPMKATKNKS